MKKLCCQRLLGVCREAGVGQHWQSKGGHEDLQCSEEHCLLFLLVCLPLTPARSSQGNVRCEGMLQLP